MRILKTLIFVLALALALSYSGLEAQTQVQFKKAAPTLTSNQAQPMTPRGGWNCGKTQNGHFCSFQIGNKYCQCDTEQGSLDCGCCTMDDAGDYCYSSKGGGMDIVQKVIAKKGLAKINPDATSQRWFSLKAQQAIGGFSNTRSATVTTQSMAPLYCAKSPADEFFCQVVGNNSNCFCFQDGYCGCCVKSDKGFTCGPNSEAKQAGIRLPVKLGLVKKLEANNLSQEEENQIKSNISQYLSSSGNIAASDGTKNPLKIFKKCWGSKLFGCCGGQERQWKDVCWLWRHRGWLFLG